MVWQRSILADGLWFPADGSPPLPALIEGQTPTTVYTLVYSTSPSRTAPKPLAGATVVGDIYPVLAPADGVMSATFRLTGPDGAQVPIPGGSNLAADGSRTEQTAPHDAVGTTADGLAAPFATAQLVNGAWTWSVDVITGTGVSTVSAQFFAANPPPIPPGPPGATLAITSTGATVTITPPGDVGRPSYDRLEFRWVLDGVTQASRDLPPADSSEQILFSVKTAVAAQVRAVNIAGASSWTSTDTRTFTPAVVSTRQDYAPLGGAQALADGSNRRPGIEVGVPSGTSLVARGGGTFKSSTTLSNADISGQVVADGAGVVLKIRSSRVRFGGRGDMVRAVNGAVIELHDCELDGLRTLRGRVLNGGSGGGKFRAYRTWSRNMGEGPRMGSGCVYSFGRVEDPVLVLEFDGLNRTYGHDDLFQSTSGSGWTIDGNWCDGRRVDNPTLSGDAVAGGPANGEYCYAGLMFQDQSGRSLVTRNYWNACSYGFNSHAQAPTVCIEDNLFGGTFPAGRRRRGCPDLEQWVESTRRGWHPTTNRSAATGSPVGF